MSRCKYCLVGHPLDVEKAQHIIVLDVAPLKVKRVVCRPTKRLNGDQTMTDRLRGWVK